MKALRWVRKSKGSDDDIGLEDQREATSALAGELADDVEDLDLGVHTGFSSMTREGDELLDQNTRVTEVVERIREGEFDYLVAYDDRRVCRDEYFSVIKHACVEGDCEIVYYADVQDDDLTFDLKRRIERDTKEEEIRKAKRALARRREQGCDEGRPKTGTKYDDDGRYLVPGEKFDDVLLAITLRDEGASYSELEDATPFSRGTLAGILDRRDWYLDLADEHDVEMPDPAEAGLA